MKDPLGWSGLHPYRGNLRPVPSTARTPITVVLVDDYDVVVMGVANMFDSYRDHSAAQHLASGQQICAHGGGAQCSAGLRESGLRHVSLSSQRF